MLHDYDNYHANNDDAYDYDDRANVHNGMQAKSEITFQPLEGLGTSQWDWQLIH